MWTIQSADSSIDKSLKKYRSDKDLICSYRQAIINLGNSEDPTTLGERKHGRFKYCYSFKLTKSYRLLYRVFIEEKIIQLIALGDHKELFGHDG